MVGQTLTLVKTETGIPWYIAFGAMQHLTPATSRTMIQLPWYAWEDAGVPVNLEITRIPVQPTQATRFPMISIGFSGISGMGATINDSKVITNEGSVSAECETQCLESSFGLDEVLVYGGTVKYNTADMLFYVNESNQIYVGITYGAGNRTTAFLFNYARVDGTYPRETTTTSNNHCYPADNKSLYINGVSVNSNYACVDLSCLFTICSFDFKVSCKMFATQNGLEKYKDTGDDSEDIEHLIPTPEGDVAEDRKVELFYNSTIYKAPVNSTEPPEKFGASSVKFTVQYKKNDGTVLLAPEQSIVGYCAETAFVNQYYGNIKWKKNAAAKILNISAQQTYLENGEWKTRTFDNIAVDAFPWNDKSFGFIGVYEDAGYQYTCKYGTNIRIYYNESDADATLGGDPTKQPINTPTTGKDGVIGEPTIYNLQENDVSNDMSSCWILDKNALNELAAVFATGCKTLKDDEGTTLGTVVESSLRSLMAHAEPVDMVCDLFYLPFNPEEFGNCVNSEISISRDEYGVLTTMAQISDEFSEQYDVRTSLGYDWFGGPGVATLYNIKQIADSIESIVGPADTDTPNVLHQGQYHGGISNQ